MALDPVVTNQNRYKVVFENERVRVLEYTRQKPASVAPLRATAVHGTAVSDGRRRKSPRRLIRPSPR